MTLWHMNDLFGLKTADKVGTNMFDHTSGNLQLSLEELVWWVNNYFTDQ